MSAERMILVYSSPSGHGYRFRRTLSRTFGRPDRCTLSALTKGIVGIPHQWADFVHGLGMPVSAFHGDAMPDGVGSYIVPNGIQLPVVLLKYPDGYRILATAEDIRECDGDTGRFSTFLASLISASA